MPPTQLLQILVADDLPLITSLVYFILTDRGHVVNTAQDGRAALELVQRQDYDAVLMDLQMPGMDGLAATAAIRALPEARKASVPVIGMSGRAVEELRECCRKVGMDEAIAKPFDEEELIRLVESLASRDRISGQSEASR